jgi:hypothetical protein
LAADHILHYKEVGIQIYKLVIQGDHKVSVHLMITVQKTYRNILNSFTHHENLVRVRDNGWR